MGQASSSASSSGGGNATGGNLNVNAPNPFVWLIAGLGMLLAAFLWRRKKKKK
jgi:LPXTG-motif cell wall-anchored protein